MKRCYQSYYLPIMKKKMIQKAAGTIGGILQKEAIDYEIIFVDDGSKDGTWQQIEQTQKEDQHVNGVRFPEISEKNLP